MAGPFRPMPPAVAAAREEYEKRLEDGFNLYAARDVTWPKDLSNLDFSGAALDYVCFEGCSLRGSSFVAADLQQARFVRVDLRDTDFTGAHIRSAILSEADLTGAIGLPPVPRIEHLDAKIVERLGIEGDWALDMTSWHDNCGTTHCRGGWAIVIAMEEYPALALDRAERTLGSSVLAALLYHAATGRVPDFHATEHEAMEDMREAAAKDPLPTEAQSAKNQSPDQEG